MPNPKIELPERPASEAEVQAFEKLIGARLPPDYRIFLLTHNGGCPEPQWHFKGDVSAFMSLDNEGSSPKLEQYLDIYRNRIPDDAIAIGLDSVGDALCLRVGRDGFGELHFWEFGKESDEERVGNQYYNMTKLASSFTEFLSTLDEFEKYFKE
jgi:hypothetical protein